LLKRLGSSVSFNLLSLEAKVISPRLLYLFDLAKHNLKAVLDPCLGLREHATNATMGPFFN
jgi:hypothetical protein